MCPEREIKGAYYWEQPNAFARLLHNPYLVFSVKLLRPVSRCLSSRSCYRLGLALDRGFAGVWMVGA